MLSIQLLSRLLALALSVFLARVLGVTEYGNYAYVFAIVGLFSVLAEFGFPTLLERTVTTSVAQQRWPLLAGLLRQTDRWVFVSGGTAAVIVIALSLSYFDSINARLFCTAALLIPLSALFRCWASQLVGFGRVELGRFLELVLRPAAMLAAALGLWALTLETTPPGHPESHSFSAEQAMMLQCATLVLSIAMARWLLWRNAPMPSNVAPDYRERSNWLSSARAFAFTNAANVVIASAGLITVGIFSSPEEAGYLRVATQGALTVAIGLQSANALLSPSMARLWAEGKPEELQRLVTRSVRWVTLLAVAIFLVFVVIGKPLLVFVYGLPYEQSFMPLIVLAGGQAVNTAYGSVGALLNMTGHERIVARAVAMAAATCVIASIALTPFFGALGAAVATVLALVSWNTLLARAVRQHLAIRPTVVGL